MNDAAVAPTGAESISLSQLADAVRRELHVDDLTPVTVTEQAEFSNINYVYRVELQDRSLYLKVVPERPRNFPVNVPRERVYSEAAGLRRFHELADDIIVIPEVLFVDSQLMTLAMSDVGQGRQVLFPILAQRFDLLAELADSLGWALAAIHRGTLGEGSMRPPPEEYIVRKIIFDGLLGPGAQLAIPELWPQINAEMQSHRECLVHGDLWSKNLLVKQGAAVAVVDFEGVHYGDPAFDLGTLAAVALLPAVEDEGLVFAALDFIARLLHAWKTACGSEIWWQQVSSRVLTATAVFLATRGFGPFAYKMTPAAQGRLLRLVRSLAAEPPVDLDNFASRVKQFIGPSTSME